MSLTITAPTHHDIINVGQQYEALPLKSSGREGPTPWEYPHGKGNVTVKCVSEEGESTEYGIRSYDAVWYRHEGSSDVVALTPEYFLESFSRI